MTAAEVAELLRVKPRWVLDHAKTEDLPSFKVGKAVRFSRRDITAWLDARRRGVQSSGRHLQAIGGN